MVVIALDTNFVAPRVIHGGRRNSEANLLDRMLFLQSKGYLRVSALIDRADYLVTTNIGDFPNPLSFCRVITEKELANVLPIYP